MKKPTYIKLSVLFLVLAFSFVLPRTSSAQSVSDLQAQINALLAEVQQLQAQLAQMQGTSAQWCHTFNHSLSIDQSGSEVTALQTALQKDGESITATNSFDDQTASAVTGFQEKYASDILTPKGLKYGTGYVGASTRAKLNSLYGCPTSPMLPPTTTAQPLITIISPNGGEVWETGSSQTVQVKYQGANSVYDRIQIGLSAPSLKLLTEVSAKEAVSGIYVNVPNVTPGKYKIRAILYDSSALANCGSTDAATNCPGGTTAVPKAVDESDNYFTIVASTTVTPMITVISPNGGEAWSIGGSYNIQYQLVNWDKSSALVYLDQDYPAGSTKTGTNSSILVGERAANDNNSFTYTVPSYQTTGSGYRIRVCSKDMSACDSSDIPFSIVTAGTATSAPTVTFIGTPTLTLSYDSSGKEANLVASAKVKVTTGNAPINSNGLPYILQFYRNGYGFVSSNSMHHFGDTGSLGTLAIPANTSATFTITGTAPTKELFAGSYTLGINGFSYPDPNNSNSYQTVSPTGVSANVDGTIAGVSPVTIVGEVSPYITGVVNDATPNVNVTITGVRFDTTSNVVSVAGKTKTFPSFNNGTTINFQMTDFGLTSAGNYPIQVTSPTTGASNNYYANITNAPQNISAPTVTFIGTPTLTLSYDSAGKEANLVSSAMIKVTAGSMPINSTASLPQIVQFYRNNVVNGSNGATGSNSMRFIIASGPGTIPANTSATFTITGTAPTKELFAGSYTLSLSGFNYPDANNSYQTVQPTSFVGVSASAGTIAGVSSVTIVGEVSPYISNIISSDVAGNVIVSGVRLGNSGISIVSLNGRTMSYPVVSFSGSDSISFKPSDFGITVSGNYQLQIINSSVGNSNVALLNYTAQATSAPTITVLSPNGGEAWQTGTVHTLRWSTQNAPQNAGVQILLVSPSQGNIVITQGITAATGYFNWTVAASNPVSDAKIEILLYPQGTCFNCGQSTLIASDQSDVPFTITATTSAQTTQSSIGQSSQMANILESTKALLQNMEDFLKNL
jgi:hypothetical protein